MNLSFQENLEYTQTPKLVFWLPPVEFKVPPAPEGHVYVRLHEGLLKSFYEPYRERPAQISEEIFKQVLSSADFVIKVPCFKYNFCRGFLFLIMIYMIYRLAWAFFYLDLDQIVYCFCYLVVSPFLMKIGCKQYLERMKKYEKVLAKALAFQNRGRLAGTGIVVRPGSLCLWLDFYYGDYTPPGYPQFASPVWYPPGSEIDLV